MAVGNRQTMAKIARYARSFGHRAPGSTRSCPLPLAPLATSAISGFAPLTAFAKSLRQENASIFYDSGTSQTRRTLNAITNIFD
jgi:hypothetical protein